MLRMKTLIAYVLLIVQLLSAPLLYASSYPRLTVSGDGSSIYFDGVGNESSNESQDIYLHVYFGMSPNYDYISKLKTK